MRNWTYEKTQQMLDCLSELYVAKVFDFEESVKIENDIWSLSGWTHDELMTECESRLLSITHDKLTTDREKRLLFITYDKLMAEFESRLLEESHD